MLSQESGKLADLGNRLLGLSYGIYLRVEYYEEIYVQETRTPDVLQLLNALKGELDDISEMLEIALRIDESFGIEAHALLSLMFKYYDEAADFAESTLVRDENYALQIITDAYKRVHGVVYPAVEILGAKLIAKSQFDGQRLKEVPLTRRAQHVYEIILEHGPVTGPAILELLDGQSQDEIYVLDQSALTKEIIPELKRMRGVENRRGVGYYDPNK